MSTKITDADFIKPGEETPALVDRDGREKAGPGDGIDLQLAMHRGQPVRYLQIFRRLTCYPNRYRHAFTLKQLGWLVRVWEAAALASGGNDLMIREMERYRYLADTLAAGMFEHKEHGIMFMNLPEDWPRLEVIDLALGYLDYAEMHYIQ